MRGRDRGRRGAASWTATRRGPAGSTCWRSTSSAWPAPRPFHPDDAVSPRSRAAAPYAALTRRDFDDVLGFVENGGYALAAYERFRKLFRDAEGLVHVAQRARSRGRLRMNLGTIVEAPLLKVRYAGRGGRCWARSRSISLNTDARRHLHLRRPACCASRRIRETAVEVAAAATASRGSPPMPARRLPLTTYLAARVRAILHDPRHVAAVPRAGARMAAAAARALARCRRRTGCWSRRSRATAAGIWSPTASRAGNAHQTLGMLLTRRMERARLRAARLRRHRLRARDLVGAPADRTSPRCSSEDMLGDDLEAWMAESRMLRRTFRNVAVIAGLIEKQPARAPRRPARR